MQRRDFLRGRGTLAFGLFGSSSAPHIVHTALLFEVTRVFLCHRVPHKSSSFMMSSREYVALSKKRTAERDDDDGFPFTSYIEIFKEGGTIIKQELSWRHHLVWGIGVVIFHRNKSRNLTGKLPISQASSYTPGAFHRARRKVSKYCQIFNCLFSMLSIYLGIFCSVSKVGTIDRFELYG